jgi:3D (Asp-Asp-Asp) domain-containing protein
VGAKPFTASAYCLNGKTQSGVRTRKGIIAADPRVLPRGSIVWIYGPTGRRQGTYTVADTGGSVKGREIDIFMPSCRAAKRFGVRRMRVAVLRRGLGS